MNTPHFEANGWQAVVADQFTFANLRLLTQAICNHIRRLQSYIDNFPPRLVVGYDNRFMGQHFAEVAAEVILQNGLDVYFADRPAPTPVVSWMISNLVTTGAIMITGADEAFQYNGVKYITSRMAIAPEDATEDIEHELARLAQLSHPLKVTPIPGEKEVHNPKPAYFRQVERFVDLAKIASISDQVTVDYLHGIASGYLRELLRPHGGKLAELQNNPLADFGQVVPSLIPDNLIELQQQVRNSEGPFALGLALDGDGSHLQVVDESGALVPHEEIFGLLLDYLLTVKGLEGGLVKTNRRHDFAEKVAALHGVPVTYTQTSDFRVITTNMVQEQALLASDGLGGYAFDGHIMERDALMTSLLLMEILAVRQQPLTQQLAELRAKV
ncbi:MAG TPA: hypothetical protein V6D23_09145 [Candidatus Obscuribacterales bacterium]